jgi:hypothetical protein
MRRARGMLIGVSNIYPPKSDEQIWTVAFHVAGEGVRGSLLVPLSQGVFNGENTLKVARNKLRVFCSNPSRRDRAVRSDGARGQCASARL